MGRRGKPGQSVGLHGSEDPLDVGIETGPPGRVGPLGVSLAPPHAAMMTLHSANEMRRLEQRGLTATGPRPRIGRATRGDYPPVRRHRHAVG